MVEVRKVNIPINVICHATFQVFYLHCHIIFRIIQNVGFVFLHMRKQTVITVKWHCDSDLMFFLIPLFFNGILCLGWVVFSLKDCSVHCWTFRITDPGALRHQYWVIQKNPHFPQPSTEIQPLFRTMLQFIEMQYHVKIFNSVKILGHITFWGPYEETRM